MHTHISSIDDDPNKPFRKLPVSFTLWNLPLCFQSPMAPTNKMSQFETLMQAKIFPSGLRRAFRYKWVYICKLMVVTAGGEARRTQARAANRHQPNEIGWDHPFAPLSLIVLGEK